MPRSIDIPDFLFDGLVERFGPAQFGKRVAAIIESGLADPEIDLLTGCRSKQALEWDLYSAIEAAARERGRYLQSFLCCDVDNFSQYVDYHGFGSSDELLIHLANRLKCTGKAVYRYSGDEFVVLGQGDSLCNLHDLGVDVRQCVVEVDLPIEKARLKRAKSWVMFHLHYGLVQPRLEGVRILCGENAAWNSK